MGEALIAIAATAGGVLALIHVGALALERHLARRERVEPGTRDVSEPGTRDVSTGRRGRGEPSVGAHLHGAQPVGNVWKRGENLTPLWRTSPAGVDPSTDLPHVRVIERRSPATHPATLSTYPPPLLPPFLDRRTSEAGDA